MEQVAEQVADQHRTKRGRIVDWIRNHDESRVFMVLYIGAALILSIAISLFWLVFVVAIHFALEYVKQRELVPTGILSTTVRASWEILLDIGLVLFALCLALYLDVIFGIVGIGVAARAGVQTAAQAGTRFAGWQQVIRGVALSLDDVLQVGRSIGRKKSGAVVVDFDETPPPTWGGWTQSWGRGDKLCVGFTVVCLVLVTLAPVTTPNNLTEVLQTIAVELHPWP